jgi:hypothetical protein
MAKQARGTCALCGYEGTKAALTKHLQTCPSQHDLATGKPEKLVQVRVTSPGVSLYWLDIEIKQSSSLLELDQFLRDVWLECCGHLSAFEINHERYSVPYQGFDEYGDKSMDIKASKVLSTGLSFTHEYDFGSTTELELKVVAEREGRFTESLRLLSRNKPHEWTCHECNKPATWINTEDMFETDNPFYCTTHMEKHPNQDYAFLPVANSPRMGVCGYSGD